MTVNIIGSGISGLSLAAFLSKHGIYCKVIEQRSKVGGNCSSHIDYGIEVHDYGPHVFHTSNANVWKFIQQFAEFNQFKLEVLSYHNNKLYHLPFGLDLVNSFFNKCLKPNNLDNFLKTKRYNISNPSNLEEHALSLVGKELYEAFIKGYTIKQWNTNPKKLPVNIIKRLPFRNTYNNNYFNDMYQGIPIGGYQKMLEKMVDSPLIDIQLNLKFSLDQINKDDWYFYSGQIDKLMDFKYGKLEWRSLDFKFNTLDQDFFQAGPIINYPNIDIQYTRICEYKHFHPENIITDKTIISYEFPQEYTGLNEAYYPVNTPQNIQIYHRYVDELHVRFPKIILCGRLAQYKYFDMDDAIENALKIGEDFLTNYII